MKFSIILVTYDRPKELMACLESIRNLRLDEKFHNMHEVIVVFNGDLTYFEKFSRKFSNYQIQFIHKTTPSNARNHAILKASGEYFLFLDDDCTLPPDYFSHVEFTKNWDVFGGPDHTPLKSTSFQKIIGKVLTSPFCMGPTSSRHQIGTHYSNAADERMLILCNLWFKASLFKEEGHRFNPDLFRNEENFLLKELKIANKSMHYSQKLFVYHQRKNDLEKLGLSIIKSGECRVQNFAMIPSKKELIYFLPLIWFVTLIFVLFHPENFILNLYLIYGAVIALYYLVMFRSVSLLYVFLHYFVLTTYSIGLIKGLWKSLPQLYTNLRANKSLMSESKSK